MMQTKVCAACKQGKPLTDFPLRSRDGLPYSYCRECENGKQREKHQRRKQRVNNPAVAEKLCPDCAQTKQASEFTLVPWNKDGLNHCCKPCAVKRSRKVALRNKNSEPIHISSGQKRCASCKKTKPVSEFHSNRAMRDHLSGYCKT